ncbi:MAG: flagellar filament capping protein FliD [Pyrinomonadaceae bacterium]
MASSISFSGLGSGIDFDTIRDAILASRSRSVSILQSQITDYSGRIEALKTLNTGLAGLKTAADALVNRDLGFARSITTSDASVATAQAASSTAIGTYDLDVTRLASNLTQNSRNYTSEDAAVLFGAATEATFELRKGGASEGVEITIDSENNTLAGLRDAINEADAGVRASIIDVNGDGTGFRLVLTSDETGSAGRVELVETTATGTDADLGITTVNPVSGDFSELNAVFKINGIEVTRGTNVIDDTVGGVTLNLKDTGQSTISVVAGTDIQNRLATFVNQYNAIVDFVGEQYNKDSLGRPTGALAGEATLRSVYRQLKDVVRTVSGNNGGTLTSLAEIGIKTQSDGKLEIDSVVLNERIEAGGEDVRALLYGLTESDKGIFQQVQDVAENLGDSISGTVQLAIEGYQTSIETISGSITKRLEYIDRLRETLTRQFAAADAAIGQLNGQGTALKGIFDSLNNNNQN